MDDLNEECADKEGLDKLRMDVIKAILMGKNTLCNGTVTKREYIEDYTVKNPRIKAYNC
jgi:hypothetical protein